jgi:PII-like signaling protein
MLLRRPAKLLRLHFSEEDRYKGVPLYEAVVQACRSLGIAGATVFRGMEGYGESTEIHRRRIIAHDEPIVVTIVESAENIERLMPEIEKMVDTGMIAISDVEMIRIEGQSGSGG